MVTVECACCGMKFDVKTSEADEVQPDEKWFCDDLCHDRYLDDNGDLVV